MLLEKRPNYTLSNISAVTKYKKCYQNNIFKTSIIKIMLSKKPVYIAGCHICVRRSYENNWYIR